MTRPASRWIAIPALLALATMLGCQGISTGKSSTSPATGVLAAAPASISFGNVPTGTTQSQTDILTNTGSSSVTITQETVSGGAGFSTTGVSLPLTLAPQQTASFQIVFSPTTAGSVNGTLALANDGSTSSVNIAISGMGTAQGSLNTSPISFNFGTVAIGSSQIQTETVKNIGGENLTISAASIGGVFALSGLTLPLTLEPNQSSTFGVLFAPGTPGPTSGTLSLTVSGSSTSVDIALSGTGVLPGTLTASLMSLTFTNVQVGQNQTQTETVQNTGSTTVTISAATVSGTGFSISGISTPLTLMPGQSTSFKVTLTPPSAGNFRGSVSITSDASNPSLTIPLSGNSTAAAGALSVGPTIAVGNVVVGTSGTAAGTLTAGGASVRVSSVTLGGTNPSEFSISGVTFPVTVTTSQPVTFTVTFTPGASGAASATASFASNASNTPSIANLTGTGTAAAGPNNPISYNAITNTNTYSGSAPRLGAAGTTTTDPDFNSNVMRVTQSGSCGASSGHSFASNEGTGWSRTINSNDTALLLNLDNGDWYVQPVTLSASGMSLNGSCVAVAPPLTGSEMNFYATNPSLVYGLDSDNAHFDSYNWSTATKTQVLDVATISGFTSTTLFLATCDGNDAWCATSSNTQNNGTQAAFYNIQTKATAVVNIANATVQLGSASPVAMDNATSTFLAGCGIHEIIPGLDGTWWTITLDGCTYSGLPHDFDNLFWQLGTNHVTYIQDTNEVGGHEAMGVGATYTAAPGSPSGCSPYSNYWTVLWDLTNLGGNPGNWVGVFSCSSIWGSDDNHFSWLNNYNDSYANSYPMLSLTTAATTNTGAPYEWELDMLNMAVANATRKTETYGTWPSSETVWRIAHSYNDPVNNQCAAQGYQSPNISSDGKYISFTSDWLGGTGTGTCTNSRRTDVFVAALP
jgi:hypothetical protein